MKSLLQPKDNPSSTMKDGLSFLQSLGTLTLLFYASFIGIAAWYIIGYFASPLRKYPGPRVAGK